MAWRNSSALARGMNTYTVAPDSPALRASAASPGTSTSATELASLASRNWRRSLQASAWGQVTELLRLIWADEAERVIPTACGGSCAPAAATMPPAAFTLAVDRFLAETRPTFEPDDAQMYLDLYRDADPEDAFDHFEEQRETNVEYLRDLPSEAGGRVALHREAGQITLNQMLHEWALHDLGHIRQIAELVRARKYLEGARPLGSNYQLNP